MALRFVVLSGIKGEVADGGRKRSEQFVIPSDLPNRQYPAAADSTDTPNQGSGWHPSPKRLAILILIFFSFSNNQSPSPESKKDSEKETRIFTDDENAFAQRLVQARRYDCATVENMRDYLLGGGVVVKCRGSRGQDYWFNIEDRGGQWHHAKPARVFARSP